MSDNEIQILDGISPKLANELVTHAHQRVKSAKTKMKICGIPTVQLQDSKATPQNIRYTVSWLGEEGMISVECILAQFNGHSHNFLDMGIFTRERCRYSPSRVN